MLRVIAIVYSLFTLANGFGNYSNFPKGLRDPVPLKSSILTGSRIIGGQTTTIEKHPYAVSLQHEWDDYQYDTIHACTGTILSEDWILISAQCAYLFDVANVTVRVGSDYFHQNGILRQVAEVIVHPFYDIVTVDYDVALLKLNESLVLSNTVQPIKLPRPNVTVHEGTNFTLASWGAVYYAGDMSIQLQEITMSTISEELCATVWYDRVTDRMFCGYEEYVGICIGDTGTPAIVDGVIIGIASWSYACADYGFPAVFTDLTVLVEWVTEITGVSSAPVTTPFFSLLITAIVLLKMTIY